MTSSGEYAYGFPINATCTDECGFGGDVEATFDPQISSDSCEWTCPDCSKFHTEERP